MVHLEVEVIRVKSAVQTRQEAEVIEIEGSQSQTNKMEMGGDEDIELVKEFLRQAGRRGGGGERLSV